MIKETKICTMCKKEIDICNFHKDKNTQDGFRSHCKNCIKDRYNNNKDKYKKRQKENYNPESKSEYYKKKKQIILEKNKEYKLLNKEKLIQYRKERYNNDKERFLSYTKDYYKLNKEKVLNRQLEYEKNRLKNDSLYRFKCNIKSNIRSSFLRGKAKFKKQTNTEKILGCSIEYFQKHIESNFQEGMSFDNHGEWHIDHIIPLATAKTIEDVIKLNHYTNLQPLWAIDNLKKGAKKHFKILIMETSVEWLAKRLYEEIRINGDGRIIDNLLEQASLIHKQEIIDAHISGQPLYSCQSEKAEQYYQETFKQK